MIEKISQCTRDAKSVALILLDIDDFKDVNDAYGQAAGDVFLEIVASRLFSIAGTIGFVARMGADEFAVLLQERSRHALDRTLKGLHKALSVPFSVQKHTLYLTSSMGVAVRCSSQRYSSDELLRDASLALDEAKKSGKNCYRVCRKSLRFTCNEKLETLQQVRKALSSGQLELYYQAKTNLRDRSHCGFEALIRWKTQDGRVVSPGSFLAAFDDPALSIGIGNYVVTAAIRQARRWMMAGIPFGSIAINLSASQFRDSDLGNRILNEISAADIDPKLIEVEVTEGVFLSAPSNAVLVACRILKEGGVSIAFDDFGTGFASLTHLGDFPVDTIKIDRSFIAQLWKGKNTAAIVNAMVGLAHNLSMKIVAEGVETLAQAEFLKAIGCDMAQGYFFARPLPAAAAAQQLQTHLQSGNFG